ncbi:hypothetical protein SDJN02_16541, partial [Cucurbita argyrosperma subsp. argyrosperma]
NQLDGALGTLGVRTQGLKHRTSYGETSSKRELLVSCHKQSQAPLPQNHIRRILELPFLRGSIQEQHNPLCLQLLHVGGLHKSFFQGPTLSQGRNLLDEHGSRNQMFQIQHPFQDTVQLNFRAACGSRKSNTDMVVVGVEILLLSIEFNGYNLVGAAAIGSCIGEAHPLPPALIRQNEAQGSVGCSQLQRAIPHKPQEQQPRYWNLSYTESFSLTNSSTNSEFSQENQNIQMNSRLCRSAMRISNPDRDLSSSFVKLFEKKLE